VLNFQSGTYEAYCIANHEQDVMLYFSPLSVELPQNQFQSVEHANSISCNFD